MNSRALPHKIALTLAIFAFGIIWIVGTLCRIQGYAIAYRALLAAAAFWAAGLVMGRVFVNGITEAAVAEHLRKERSKKSEKDARKEDAEEE